MTHDIKGCLVEAQHVMPVGDLREHDSNKDCWCRPEHDEEYNIYVHNSLDGREAYETGQRQTN